MPSRSWPSSASTSIASSSIERPIVPPAPAEFSISSHVSPLQRFSACFIAAHDLLQRGVEPAAEVRADVEDDAVRLDRTAVSTVAHSAVTDFS